MMFRSNRFGRLRIKQLLNRGGEARVWLAEGNLGRRFAVKDYFGPSDHHMRNEIRAHELVGPHDNISSPLDTATRLRAYKEGGKARAAVALVYAYYPAGDLVDYYELCDMHSEAHVLCVTAGMWDALARCHARGLCHRDVKPQNLLYDRRRQTVVLTDFGLSAPASGIVRAGTTLLYAAPECYGRTVHPPYDHKCDVWSAAATHLSLLWGSDILKDNSGHNIRRRGHRHLQKNYGAAWDDLSNTTRAVLSASLVPLADDRCEASDIVSLLS